MQRRDEKEKCGVNEGEDYEPVQERVKYLCLYGHGRVIATVLSLSTVAILQLKNSITLYNYEIFLKIHS